MSETQEIDEDFQHDPYSAAIVYARAAIKRALENSGGMNETEHQNLLAIEEFIRTTDNA